MPTLECPTCGRTVAYSSRQEIPFRPFCCRRCKLVDLGKWLNEEYAIREDVSEPEIDYPRYPDGSPSE